MPIYLRLERQKRGLTQEELAKQLGISRSYLALMETQRMAPGKHLGMEIERYFGKSIDYLFTTLKI